MKKWLLSCLIVVATFIPFIPVLFRQFFVIKRDFWLPQPNFLSLFYTFEDFMLGYNANSTAYLTITILCSGLFILAIYNNKKQKEVIGFLLAFLFIPIVISFIISQWAAIYSTKHVMLVSPFYYIIIGYGLIKIKPHIIKSLFLVMLSLLVTSSLVNYYSNYMPTEEAIEKFQRHDVYAKIPFNSSLRYIEKNLKKGDIIAHSCFLTTLPFLYYRHWKSDNYLIIFPIKNKCKQKFSEGIGKVMPVIDLERKGVRYDFKRVWLVSLPEIGELLTVRKWMDNEYVRQNRKEFGKILVELYSSRD